MTARSPSTRTIALAIGVFLLLFGVAGALPALTAPLRGLTALTVTGGAGLLFGLFPVNWLADLAHLALGIWGILAAQRFVAARSFLRAAALILAVLALCGLVPGAHLLFGLMPLNAHDVWLHGGLALLAAVFGWRAVSVTDEAGLTAAPVTD